MDNHKVKLKLRKNQTLFSPANLARYDPYQILLHHALLVSTRRINKER
ncbi:formate transporter FocA, partial [Cronobacter sakazakii]